jgi:hypothetical protein
MAAIVSRFMAFLSGSAVLAFPTRVVARGWCTLKGEWEVGNRE